MSYGECLWKLIKSRNTAERNAFRLNMKKEQDYMCVCEMFGGEEHLKQEYPDLYEALANSRNRNDISEENENGKGLQDTACIYDLSEKDGKVRSYGSMILKDQAERLYVKITLYHNGKEIASDFSFSNDSCHKMLGCEGYVKNLSDDTELSAVIHGCWNPKGKNELQSYVVESSMQGTMKTAINKIVLYDPVKWNTEHTPAAKVESTAPAADFWEYFTNGTPHDNKTNETINVCYNRYPERGEVRDYVYPDRNPSGRQGVFLDVRGIIELKEKIYDHFGMAWFILDTKTKGGIFQMSNIKECHFHALDDGKKVCFAFPTYWNNEIEGSEIAGFANAELVGEVQFYCRNEQGKVENRPESAKFAGELNFLKGGSSKQVSVNAIKLMWGCVLEGTEIEMADGTEKKVENIQPGDMVKTSGGISAVSVVVKGNENTIWHLKAKDAGKELCVSKDHPILTPDGSNAVNTLKSEDKILLNSGKYSKIEYLYEEEGDFTVYNLLLASENIFYGNKYAIGDQQLQKETGQKLKTVSSVREVVRKETEKLRKEFGK